jgi:hypothetical protein
VLEEAGNTEIALPDGFEMLERRDYGETQMVLLRGVSHQALSLPIQTRRHPGRPLAVRDPS